MLIVALSGPIAAGKTTLGHVLENRIGAHLVTVSDLLRSRQAAEGEMDARRSLADLGDELVSASAGRWVLEYIDSEIAPLVSPAVTVLDAVRRLQELSALRADPNLRVLHVFLEAPPKVLRRRFSARGHAPEEYDALRRHPSEVTLPKLKDLADAIFDSSLQTPDELAGAVVFRLRRLSQTEQ